MKQFVKMIILTVILTFVILYSYACVQDKIGGKSIREFYSFLNHEKQETEENDEEDTGDQSYRAVWLSYQEFNAYRNSVTKNTASSFRRFFRSVLRRCKKLHLNTVIVQVRPYGDALYPSDYYPWAACISGKQGEDPGYDPLEIMVKEAHAKNIRLEAWINPYRISSDDMIQILSKDNQARRWAESTADARNVLTYDGALYYNPSSEAVRTLIVEGVKEILDHYQVDGIHMDDYFYPEFTEENVASSFDAEEYESYVQSCSGDPLSLEDWRRQNINLLVSALYQTVHEAGEDLTFGISPAGNLDNLRSDLSYYVDIDTWMGEEGYVDYIMPQIYWGFTNTQAPFQETLEDWVNLAEGSSVKLYIGLQLYRIGTEDTTQSDYQELQKENFLTEEIRSVEKEALAQGYCLFSYQYLCADENEYEFDCREFSSKRKKLLIKNTEGLLE